ncbi:unnamed protein product [Symbiodinium sp. CCMP2456]|nr:unnamed protein product [Symbiodinium sp. CCMP2456]
MRALSIYSFGMDAVSWIHQQCSPTSTFIDPAGCIVCCKKPSAMYRNQSLVCSDVDGWRKLLRVQPFHSEPAGCILSVVQPHNPPVPMPQAMQFNHLHFRRVLPRGTQQCQALLDTSLVSAVTSNCIKLLCFKDSPGALLEFPPRTCGFAVLALRLERGVCRLGCAARKCSGCPCVGVETRRGMSPKQFVAFSSAQDVQ